MEAISETQVTIINLETEQVNSINQLTALLHFDDDEATTKHLIDLGTTCYLDLIEVKSCRN